MTDPQSYQQVEFSAVPQGSSASTWALRPRRLVSPFCRVAAENVEYTEGLDLAVTAPIDIPELVATVAKLATD